MTRIFFFCLPIIVAVTTFALNFFFGVNKADFMDKCLRLTTENPIIISTLLSLLLTIVGMRAVGFVSGTASVETLALLWLFFGTIAVILFANLYPGGFKIAVIITAVVIVVCIFIPIAPRAAAWVSAFLTRSGAAERASLTTSVAGATTAAGTATGESSWWIWPIGFLVVLITLGAMSRCNTGAQTQQTSNTTGNSTTNTQSGSTNSQAGTNTGQQSSQGQPATINLENLEVKEEFRPKGNGTSGLGVTGEEEVTGLGAL
jgi:hypothetical protein